MLAHLHRQQLRKEYAHEKELLNELEELKNQVEKEKETDKEFWEPSRNSRMMQMRRFH